MGEEEVDVVDLGHVTTADNQHFATVQGAPSSPSQLPLSPQRKKKDPISPSSSPLHGPLTPSHNNNNNNRRSTRTTAASNNLRNAPCSTENNRQRVTSQSSPPPPPSSSSSNGNDKGGPLVLPFSSERATEECDAMNEYTVTGNRLTPSNTTKGRRSRGPRARTRARPGWDTLQQQCLDQDEPSDDDDDDDDDGISDDDSNDDDSNDDDELDQPDDEDYTDLDEDYEEDDIHGVCLHCSLPPPSLPTTPSSTPTPTPPTSSSNSSPPLPLTTAATTPGIQVSCDDCHAFICSDCHWCHEYQANHEIRVCDRCDAFYCKACDEMDQCEDCGEVVCSGCGSLCSCKFCGCGLCEDCATACGRCGIVLCARDAKFAVECDTCKMPYCLVCLASGTKDPCVRCGHKTSKRVEQLVHLRLKSIYKAFKQSGAALGNNNNNNSRGVTDDDLPSDMGYPKTNGGGDGSSSITGGGKGRRTKKSGGCGNGNGCGGSLPDLFPQPPNGRPWTSSKKSSGGGGGGGGGGGPASFSSNNTNQTHTNTEKYKHGTDANGNHYRRTPFHGGNNGRPTCLPNKEVGTQALHVAAAAAAGHPTVEGSFGERFHGRIPFPKNGRGGRALHDEEICVSAASDRRPPMLGMDGEEMEDDGGYDSSEGETYRKKKVSRSDRFASRTQAEADAAAEALLAELDKEKMNSEASSKAKKKKKKKKKKRQQQAAKEIVGVKNCGEVVSEAVDGDGASGKVDFSPPMPESSITTTGGDFGPTVKESAVSGKKKKKQKDKNHSTAAAQPQKKDNISTDTPSLDTTSNTKTNAPKTSVQDAARSANDESEEDDIARLTNDADATYVRNSTGSTNATGTSRPDDVENELATMVSTSDLDGIERLLGVLKGVPGRAALRKNAKKALKRIKEERAAAQEAACTEEEKVTALDEVTSEHNMQNSRNYHEFGPSTDLGSRFSSNTASRTGPLLELVSHIHGVQGSTSSSTSGIPRSECVMHMAPSVVGWVIGKGGQRIRDLMEDSGAKVWIDQDSMGPKEMRIVYVSGSRKSVDAAVRMVKELVAKAPVKTPSIVQTVNDSNTVTSSRSSLTSTPVSFVQNTVHQYSITFDKQDTSPARGQIVHHSPIAESPSIGLVGNSAVTESGSNSPTRRMGTDRLLPTPTKPPPGMEGLSSVLDRETRPSTGSPAPSMDKSTRITGTVVKEIPCEHRFVPLLIGRRGWTVKNIQDTSGARVDIDQTVDPRKIIISGGLLQVEKAVRLVEEVLSYPHAQLHHGVSATNVANANESSLQNDSSLDHFAIKGGVAHMSTVNRFSSVSHSNDPRLFPIPYEGINASHCDEQIPHQQFSMLSQNIHGTMGHYSQTDQDQTSTKLHSDLHSDSIVMHAQDQYDKNLFGTNGHDVAETPLSQIQSHMFDIPLQQHNDVTPSSQSSIHRQFTSQLQQHVPPHPFHHDSQYVPNQRFQHHSTDQSQQYGLRQHDTKPDLPFSALTPHLDTVLPLSGDIFSNGDGGISSAGQLSSDYGLIQNSQPSPTLLRQQEQEKEIIADLFGPSGDVSSNAAENCDEENKGCFLQKFSNMSVGNGDKINYQNVDWSGLAGIDDGHTSQRSVGLGGVKLDWSTDVPPLSTSTDSLNPKGKSPWGSQ